MGSISLKYTYVGTYVPVDYVVEAGIMNTSILVSNKGCQKVLTTPEIVESLWQFRGANSV
jgi:hypothetical protein